MSTEIYFDFNATAPAKPAVIEAVREAMAEGGNASSVHGWGRAARKRIEAARESVAALVGAKAERVIFTGSGTEANNQALRATDAAGVVVSAIEHESVARAVPDALVAPVGADGRIDLDALGDLVARAPSPALVSVMLANNETGVIQPIAEVAAIAAEHGARTHCDAVQAGGKIPVDMVALGVDYLTLSAHKMAGPQGVGALIVREGAPLGSFIHGGGQERGLRSGTENVPGIHGFGVAARLAAEALDDFATLADLRDGFERRVKAIAPDAIAFGADGPRLPNTSYIAMPGVQADTQLMSFDLKGLAVSTGSACAAGKVEPPHVLTAMGVPDAVAICAIRVSLGWRTEAGDIDPLVAAWEALYRRSGKPWPNAAVAEAR